MLNPLPLLLILSHSQEPRTYLQAIVIHPKRDLLESEDEETEKAKPVPKYVVSGGLTGFGVANDLMFIDFSPPEEAPEEFRAMPYNAKKLTTLKSGISGASWALWVTDGLE